MMIITKKSVSKFYNFFKHPVTAIVIGIIIAFIFYIISIRDKDPLYNISESELIADDKRKVCEGEFMENTDNWSCKWICSWWWV